MEEPCRGRPRCPEKHQRILCTAVQLLEEVGFAGFTMEAVAQKAEVGKASLYRRWSGKGPLVMEALLEKFGGELAVSETGSVVNDLLVQMRRTAEVLSGKAGKMLGCILSACYQEPELAAAFHAFLAQRRQAVRSLLERGQAEGEIRADLDLDVTMDALYGPLHYRLLVTGGSLDAAFVTTLWEHVMNGVIRRKES